jgi:hypothetical protein
MFKGLTLFPPASPTILGPAFTLQNVISSEIFYSLRPMVPRDSVTPRISKRAHNHPYCNYSGSGSHDPTDTKVSTNRRFTVIEGYQRAFSLSESSTSTIWKYSPNLVEPESLIFQPNEINDNGELWAMNQYVCYFHLHAPQ